MLAVFAAKKAKVNRIPSRNRNRMSKLTYRVQCDFRPYQEWVVEAESESEARLIVAHQLGVPYDETDAARHHGEEVQA